MITKTTSQTEYEDIMQGHDRWEVKVHEHGHVALLDVMPRLVPKGRKADIAIVQGARVSYNQGLKTIKEDENLIRYLMRCKHTSPSELVEFKFDIKCPLFVARQWLRHRTASVSEISGRYTTLPDEYHKPEVWRGKDPKNKQGSTGEITYIPYDYAKYDQDANTTEIGVAEQVAFDEYKQRIKAGVAPELARTCLPVSVYTHFIWKIDLHNLLHFLSLRCDHHAQQEIRDYAQPIYDMLKEIVPDSIQAFDDYHPYRNAINLSALDIEYLRTGLRPSTMGEREAAEFEVKKQRIGK